MQNLFKFTASNLEAYQHYIDTIERGFTLDSIKQLLSEKQVAYLHSIYGPNLIRAWGATPGRGNASTWEKLKTGDPILIYRKGTYEYYAFITFKLHNPNLARHLWKTNQEGVTWEYIYFLDKLVEISVPVKIYNELLNYDLDFNPYGFSPTDKKRVTDLVNKYGSIEAFLDYLTEGKWVEKDLTYSPEIKEQIIQERFAKQIGKTSILEANLENFLVDDVSQIEPDLKLIGRQVDTKVVGRLDLLCEDKNNDLVVVELKRGAAGPSIIDQIQRYMGWAMDKKAKPNQNVRGIIIVATKDTALEYAVKANPRVEVKTFKVTVQ